MASKIISSFTFFQRIALAVVPRLVWALLSVVGRTWRFELIAEAGHHPELEQPGRFAERLAGFLAERPAADS